MAATAQLQLFEARPERIVKRETRLSERRRNDPEVAEKLVLDYWGWAAAVASEMHRGKLKRFDRDDLVQSARIGLWKAAQWYRIDSPVRFAVFAASFVKGEVKMAVRRGAYLNASMSSFGDLKREPVYRGPEPDAGMDGRLSEESLRLVNALRAGLTLEEIAAKWGCMVADLERLAECAREELELLGLGGQNRSR